MEHGRAGIGRDRMREPVSMTDRAPTLPERADVEAAQARVRPLAIETPLLRNDALDAAAGARVWIKPECLQTTGSFKIRGAMNRLSMVDPRTYPGGVVAFSSGNHAQGVARAARHFGLQALLVMPEDAPMVKSDGVRADGAEIRFYDRVNESREEIAAHLAETRRAALVASHDDAMIVAGQGTVGLELRRQGAAAGATFSDVLCCAGGGGLVSGIALAFDGDSARPQFWTVEPEGHDDWARSLASGEISTNAPGVRSFCDAILTPAPGNIPFALARTRLAGGFVVSDDEVRAAMRFAFRQLKLVVEPGGAVALALALRGLPEAMRGRDVAIVISGGNVDAGLFAETVVLN
jgi:threonine dehydratase